MTTPAPQRIYAVGDVHGWLDKLEDIHARIVDDLRKRPSASHIVVHIGDYVDRGPESRNVLDFLIAGADQGAPWINLLGNHDQMFLKFLEKPGGRDARLRPDLTWLHPRLGGSETLRAYGITADHEGDPDGHTVFDEAKAAVPETHIRFLSALPRFHAVGPWFFAHAGIRPGVPLDQQDADDLLWIRAEFLESTDAHGATIVHGHTPVETVEDHGNRIAIDTGAAYGGPLSCLVLEGVGAHVLGGPLLRQPEVK